MVFGSGRGGSYMAPLAQIGTCGTTAYGYYLVYVARNSSQGTDVHF